MIIDYPTTDAVPSLKALWKEAFGDDDGFINAFFSLGFSPKRALCAYEEEKLLGALYWFDMDYKGEKIAYIYGVATANSFRGRGIGTAMMKEAEKTLRTDGYEGIALVPAEKKVFHFYEKLGYKTRAYIDELEITASEKTAAAKKVSASEYFNRRKYYIENDAPTLCGEGFEFLDFLLDFYVGDDFISAIKKDTKVPFAAEFFGDLQKLRDLTKTLGFKKGAARIKGSAIPFAMYLPLKNTISPFDYLGFALD